MARNDRVRGGEGGQENHVVSYTPGPLSHTVTDYAKIGKGPRGHNERIREKRSKIVAKISKTQEGQGWHKGKKKMSKKLGGGGGDKKTIYTNPSGQLNKGAKK